MVLAGTVSRVTYPLSVWHLKLLPQHPHCQWSPTQTTWSLFMLLVSCQAARTGRESKDVPSKPLGSCISLNSPAGAQDWECPLAAFLQGCCTAPRGDRTSGGDSMCPQFISLRVMVSGVGLWDSGQITSRGLVLMMR
jgi:hypothetical protein